MAQSTFRPDIEGLRAVAVLGVLTFHSGLPLHGGFVGVDVFFVLSGYLITTLLLNELEAAGRISLLDFYARRARRLLPAATLVTLTTLAALLLFAPEAMQSDFAVDAAAAASYVANWHFAARSIDYLSEDLGRSPFLHFWSLSVEEQFYFVWPALIALGAKWSGALKISPRRVIGSVALLITLASFVIAAQAADSASEDFFETTNRAWELGVGALFAFAPAVALGRLALTAIGTLGAALIGASFALAEARHWPSIATLAPTLGTALLLWSGKSATAAKISPIHRALSTKPLIWLGGLSYSLYLWHWPLLILGQDWLDLRGPLWGTFLTVASLAPSWLSYRYVEGPLRASKVLGASPLGSVSFGLNFSLLSIALGLGLGRIVDSDPQASASSIFLGVRDGRLLVDPPKAGALALGSSRGKSSAGKPKPRYPHITPDPEMAPLDVPRAYSEGCQVPTGAVNPRWCEIGDKDGPLQGVLVGDSKILQYYESFDAVGQALGIKFRTATKSACAFAKVFGGKPSQDRDECFRFTEAVLGDLRETRPDFVITGQRDRAASVRPDGGPQTQGAMVEALRSIWEELRSLGTQVIVVVDNPSPGQAVYQCLIDHPDDARPCAFSRSEAIARSAAPVQRDAALKAPGVHLIDPTDLICPRERCAPVIGNVLIYRQGSHITNSYARTLAPFFESELKKIIGARSGAIHHAPSKPHGPPSEE